MIVTPIRTKKVVVGDKLEHILTDSIKKLEENSVIVITSKIVSIANGDIAPLSENKEDLIRQEAQEFITGNNANPGQDMLLTITDNILVPWAGIDESNGNGLYVLWPKNPMLDAEKIWKFLKKTYKLNNVGVVITDSTCMPLRTGSVNIGLSWCGFTPIKNYIGTKDVFGRKLQFTTTSYVDGIAQAAGIAVGEGNEQTPLCIIRDIPGIQFVARPPTAAEKKSVNYPREKDMFGPLLRAAKWEKWEKRSLDKRR